jgi:hypothetical protein
LSIPTVLNTFSLKPTFQPVLAVGESKNFTSSNIILLKSTPPSAITVSAARILSESNLSSILPLIVFLIFHKQAGKIKLERGHLARVSFAQSALAGKDARASISLFLAGAGNVPKD